MNALQRARISRAKTKHGEARLRTPEYRAWVDLVARCTSPSHPAYKNYGARGISVAPAWLGSFVIFLSDMGRRPGPGYSLERKDNAAGYTPDNCVWATRTAQQNNTRKTTWISYDGKTLTLHQWALLLGLSPITLHSRKRRGWSDREVLYGR